MASPPSHANSCRSPSILPIPVNFDGDDHDPSISMVHAERHAYMLRSAIVCLLTLTDAVLFAWHACSVSLLSLCCHELDPHP